MGNIINWLFSFKQKRFYKIFNKKACICLFILIFNLILAINIFSQSEEPMNDSVRELSAKEVKVEKPLTDKAFSMALSVHVGMPIPLGDTSAFLNLTIAPGVFYDFVVITSIGVISLGIGGSFDYYGVKEQEQSYVINIPVAVKADYIFAFSGFYIFGGTKVGIAVSNYKAATERDAQTGIILYLSPEAGVGYIILSWLGMSAGASFDMLIFGNGDMHMNINPFIKASLWF